MSDANINNGYSNFIISLLLLFPVVINSVKIIGNLILLIIVFMGVYILFKEKISPFRIPELKLFSWLTFGYFVVMLLSIVQNEGFVDELYHLGRKAHFALAPLIALAIYRVKLPLNKLLLNIKIGLIIIGIIVIYQDISGVGRPSGMYNANIFGDIVLVMVFFSLTNLFEEERFFRILGVISSSLGVYAVILSGNRGTFLMLVVMSVAYLLIIFKKYFSGNVKKKLISIVVLSVILGVLSTHSNVQSGFQSAYSNLFSSSEGYNVNSSSGLRVEMWRGSVEAFKDSPWTGHGYRNANAVVSKYVKEEIQETVFAFTHLHNEYITNLVSAGVIGLISVLLLLLLPLKVFIQNLKNDDTFLYSFMGIFLCLGYMGIGMTHIAFGEEHVNAFYIFFLAILLPEVIKKEMVLTDCK